MSYADDEPAVTWRLLHEGWRTIRKPQACADCLQTQPVGTRMFHIAGMLDGDFVSEYRCSRYASCAIYEEEIG